MITKVYPPRTSKQRELVNLLKANGFKEAAQNILADPNIRNASERQLTKKISEWRRWIEGGFWPWPQWDKISDKDWYSLRHQCEF